MKLSNLNYQPHFRLYPFDVEVHAEAEQKPTFQVRAEAGANLMAAETEARRKLLNPDQISFEEEYDILKSINPNF